LTIICGGSKTDNLKVFPLGLLVILFHVIKHDVITLINNDNTLFGFAEVLDTDYVLESSFHIHSSRRQIHEELIISGFVSFQQTFILKNNVNNLICIVKNIKGKSCMNDAFPLTSSHLVNLASVLFHIEEGQRSSRQLYVIYGGSHVTESLSRERNDIHTFILIANKF